MVETVDIITPIVNDPAAFGAISAANSLSDVYAMGGRPVAAMAILGFASCDYGTEVVKEIMRGASQALERAGAWLVGGHSFEDPELKFGLSVTGVIDRARILRARGARPGDVLVLTKPIGTGVLATALKGGKLDDAGMAEAQESMLQLNDLASRAALGAGATAATDVTGFGLLGHAYNMVRGSAVDFEIRLADVPVLGRARDFISSGMSPEGAYNNMRFLQGKVEAAGLSEEDLLLLADPQTSGGLLLALPGEAALSRFGQAGVRSWLIGRVLEGKGRIKVV
ncbi:MAG: selenide, water dikinase SelD [Thermodesulfovibrionales bacterium]